MLSEVARIAALLTERLPDTPVTVGKEGGPWPEGVVVYRFERKDQPSRTYPYKGTMVRVMYAPETESEVLYPDRVARVCEVLLEAYGERYRRFPTGDSGILIEGPRTRYTRERKAEYAQRAALGFTPLHEMGK